MEGSFAPGGGSRWLVAPWLLGGFGVGQQIDKDESGLSTRRLSGQDSFSPK